MGLFSRGNKNNNSIQIAKKRIFAGKKIHNQLVEDYSKYSEQNLLAQFKSEYWNVKSDQDKIAVLQEIENREAVKHNRPAAKVVQIYSSKNGNYDYKSHEIGVRLTDNQFEDLDTIFHESEHANQSKAPIDSVSFSENDKKLIEIEDMISSDGRKNHYRKYEGPLYAVMTSELDAIMQLLKK